MSVQTDISIVSVAQSLGRRISTKEQSLNELMDSLGDSPSPVQMIDLQARFSEYQMFAQLNSGLIKEIGDTLKSIVQKAS